MALQKNITEIAYSLLEIESTGEIHIYEGKFTPDRCDAKDFPICNKISRRDNKVKTIKTCLNEEEARKKAASIGRIVCGTCVSHLYESYT